MEEKDMQQHVIALVNAAKQGNQEAMAQLQQIMTMAQIIEQAIGSSNKQAPKQQQKIKAELGTKLNYISRLKGVCPEGTEKVYMAKGGCMCKKIKAQGGEMKKEQNEIKKFKAKKGCKTKK